jgi:hypothetical protein
MLNWMSPLGLAPVIWIRHAGCMTQHRGVVAAVIGLTALLVAGAGASGSPSTASYTSTSSTASTRWPTSKAPREADYDKVMVIAEENETDSAVIGSSSAPYLTKLAATYGDATNMQAGYPVDCPSLAAYILITSGDRDGICDDGNPSAHRLSQGNIFQQVADSDRQWREYAEAMPSNCSRTNSSAKIYLVRHAPPPYYTSEAKRCQAWDVPMGTTTSGQLHSDLTTGLPAYSFVTPDACDDMHGAPSCKGQLIAHGDDWLAQWMPQIIDSPDFSDGHLLVIITWDEGSRQDNHIPTLVVAPTIHGVKSAAALTHCSTLRVAEEVLDLPYLGCAADAASYLDAFPI